MARHNEARPEAAYAALGDDLIVVGVSGGADTHGIYATVAVPAYDASNAGHVAALTAGWRRLFLHAAQVACKKALKDGNDPIVAVHALAQSFTPSDASEVTTVGALRTEKATEMLTARLGEMGKLRHGDKAFNEALVVKNLPTYAIKYAEQIDQALRAYLAAGYTPVKRAGSTSGETKVEKTAPVVVEELGDEL